MAGRADGHDEMGTTTPTALLVIRVSSLPANRLRIRRHLATAAHRPSLPAYTCPAFVFGYLLGASVRASTVDESVLGPRRAAPGR